MLLLVLSYSEHGNVKANISEDGYTFTVFSEVQKVFFPSACLPTPLNKRKIYAF